MLPIRGIRTPAVIVSVAHLDDEERTLVLGVLLEEILAYTRSLPGTRRLPALVVFDECYGLLPPHPGNPPTKRPVVALMKQGRAFGVGVIIATQNPMDLDYRTLSNAGFWAVGRLQTDADRERLVDSLANANEPGSTSADLSALIRKLGPRWFLVRNVHAKPNTVLLQPRWAISYLRGPMTLGDIRRAVRLREGEVLRVCASATRGTRKTHAAGVLATNLAVAERTLADISSGREQLFRAAAHSDPPDEDCISSSGEASVCLGDIAWLEQTVVCVPPSV